MKYSAVVKSEQKRRSFLRRVKYILSVLVIAFGECLIAPRSRESAFFPRPQINWEPTVLPINRFQGHTPRAKSCAYD
jgi:hypothetical protein